MKRVITTVGSSIFDNYLEEKNDIATHYQALKDKHHKDWVVQQERINIVKKSVVPWARNKQNASAEIKSLLKMQGYLKDDLEVYLLATDSVTSRLAADIIKEWFVNNEQIKVEFDATKDVISNLQVDNYERLIKEGLPDFINRINWIAGGGTDSAGYFEDIIFNITGGYKAIIPYMTIMAAVNGCKIVYIFEDTNSLILIPPLPVKIDFEIFEAYSNEIAWLDEGIENYQQAKDSSFQQFSLLEQRGLVEEIDNYSFLSPVGRIFYERFKRKFFLFYASDDIYSELEKQGDIIRILRTKFPHKNLLESKTERKGEHCVYDDGNNNNRIYYFRNKGNCYIYKTFQSEQEAREFIHLPVDKNKIIQESKLRKMEV